MAFVLEDRVVETASNPGQGDFELLGASGSNRTFVGGIGNGNTTRYLAVGSEGWEIGLAEVSAGSPDRLLRPGSVTKNSDGGTTPIDFTGSVTLACIPSVEDVYHRGNILGAVSEDSGVPTGAIIERGRNSNGIYTKFADGTILLAGSDRESRSSDGRVTTAVTFPAQVDLSETIGPDNRWSYQANIETQTTVPENVTGISVTEESDTGMSVNIYRTTSTGTPFSYTVLARWF